MKKAVMLVVWKIFRAIVIHSSDKAMAQRVARLRWLAWVITGDRTLRSVMTEVVEIFEDGPPHTEVIRRMFREADEDFTSDLISGGIKL